ncbi:MAG TPA: hypothetical protein ENJ45_05250, partial [Phaeodactylibacter sp.]|nr:hypothetical protein [Phaeodactylibacter sp.]
MKNLLLLLLFSAGLILVSCKKDDDNTGDCDTTDLTYNKDIKAILDTNCALSGCHSETEADLQGAM